MTPAEHKTAAETTLANAERPNRIVTDHHYGIAECHAILSQRTGTGDHYATAESWVASAEQRITHIGGEFGVLQAVRNARIHALLADR